MKKASALLLFILLVVASMSVMAQKQSVLAKQAKITMEQARKAALDKEPGTVKSEELEKEKGKLIYSFDIQTSKELHEVAVDAMTGAIVEDTVETPQDEAREAAAEKKHVKKAPQGNAAKSQTQQQ